MPAAAGNSSFERQRGYGDFPAFVERPDDIVLRDLNVVEEYLVEVMMPVHDHQRLHLDALRSHIVENQITDSLVLGSVRVGAGQQKHFIRILRAGGPNLLAIYDKIVTLELRARLQSGKIRTCAGFGVTLAPDI